MKIKVKQTGVEMEIPDTGQVAKRVKEQPDDYEILPEDKKKGKGE
jgi:hypothetical protein